MSAWVTAAVQAVLVAAVAPLVIGLMRAVRARLEGAPAAGSPSRGGTCVSSCARSR
ncbi:hypothetical protein ACFQ1L_25390 [Phytohabitans flavus]|uniref:hypothetical protein n=1 Tax=Phytohabitans flavus TaxID=1076124 RepID=UPI0036389DE4